MNSKKYGSTVEYLRPDQATRIPGCIEDLATIHTGMTYLVRDVFSYSKAMAWKLCHMARPLVIPYGKNTYACIGNTQTMVIAKANFGWSHPIPMDVIRGLNDDEIREFALTEMGRTVGCALDPVGSQLNQFHNRLPDNDRLWIFPNAGNRDDFANIVGRNEKTLRSNEDQATVEPTELTQGLGLSEIMKKADI